MFRGQASDPPSRRHLAHWEAVCCYLDSRPYRSVRWPYVSDPPDPPDPSGATVPLLSTRLLKRMAKFGLVRHTEDCAWRLSLRWRTLLARLKAGAAAGEEEETAADQGSVNDPNDASDLPFATDWGVDTWYIHLYHDELPPDLIAACDEYKARAQDADQPVETPWRFFDAPLSMYKAGVGTVKKDRGVSWSFLLRNASVMLLLRRTPLSGLLGSVRLGAECLWTFGARGALDGMRRDLDALWAEALGHPGLAAPVTYKTSQIHLCADIANWAPEPEALTRVVTRSLKKAVYLPAPGDVAAAWAGEADGVDEFDDLADGALLGDAWLAGGDVYADASMSSLLAPPEWEGVPLDLLPERVADALFGGNTDDEEDGHEGASDGFADGAADAFEGKTVDLDSEGSETSVAVQWAEEGEASVYLWGQRASGFAFSPGADLSAVWYDKLLEERRSGKRWMEAIHQAGGWNEAMALTRVEVRFRRGAMRDLTSALVSPLAPPETAPRWFDDPWETLAHVNDLWGHAVGVPAEADLAPDVTYRGWLRLLTPMRTDSNRARWAVDPVWEVVQRVSFSDMAAQPLKKIPLVKHDLRQVDAELYGLLKLRAALRGQQLGTDATLSLELVDFARSADDLDAVRQRDFAEEVREKARRMGRAVPLRSREN